MNQPAFWKIYLHNTAFHATDFTLFDEIIPNPWFGENMDWFRRIDLYFTPQSPNIYTQIFSIATMLCTPHAPQQCLVRKHLTRVQSQFLQQAELCRGELNAHTLAPDLSLLKINFDVAKTLRAD